MGFNIFQYISCYCLSVSGVSFSSLFSNFNTSQVTVYRFFLHASVWLSVISIHLMLLFIQLSHMIANRTTNFNTSHVTVYRYTLVKGRNRFAFQYISCYCLSEVAAEKKADGSQFQYISCYCLSKKLEQKLLSQRNFNTSHVTVYR